MQCLKKKFFFQFQDYVDLVIWKVARNTDNHLAFFVVYNMETTEIISFYENSAEELYTLFELFCEHFHSSSKNSFYMNFLSTHSNNIHALEQLKCNKTKASSLDRFNEFGVDGGPAARQLKPKFDDPGHNDSACEMMDKYYIGEIDI